MDKNYYNSMLVFKENGKNHLFAHSGTDNRWFVSELATQWNGQAEIGNGK